MACSPVTEMPGCGNRIREVWQLACGHRAQVGRLKTHLQGPEDKTCRRETLFRLSLLR